MYLVTASKRGILCLVVGVLLCGPFAPLIGHAQVPATNSTSGDKVTTDTTGGACIDLGTCISSLVYIVPAISAFIAYIAAFFFDALAQLSISSYGYALEFLSNGWKTALSIANILFLFALIYIAVMIIFNAETSGTMRSLAILIVMALLVNFSFFGVRVVIDAGNLLAVQFYNAIQAPAFKSPAVLQVATNALSSNVLGSTYAPKVKDLTFPIMDSVKLQSLWTNNNFQEWAGRQTGIGGFLNQVITLTFLYLATAALYWVLTFAFIMNGVKFLYRTIILWFVIMAAPLALAIRAFSPPSAQKLYKMWQSYLIQFSFYPAAFFLIFYIITVTVQGITGSTGLVDSIFSDAVKSNTTVSLVDSVSNVVVRMGIVIAMLYFGLKAADVIAVQANGLAEKVTGKVRDFAADTSIRAARTTGGYAMQNTLGRAGGLADASLAKTRFGNTAFGYGLRKNTTGKAADAKFFGFESRKTYEERAGKEKLERAANVRDVENREVAGRIAQGAQTHADIERVSNMSSREFQALGRDGMWSVLHHMNPGQFNANVMRNNKLTDAQKVDLRNEWVRRGMPATSSSGSSAGSAAGGSTSGSGSSSAGSAAGGSTSGSGSSSAGSAAGGSTSGSGSSSAGSAAGGSTGGFWQQPNMPDEVNQAHELIKEIRKLQDQLKMQTLEIKRGDRITAEAIIGARHESSKQTKILKENYAKLESTPNTNTSPISPYNIEKAKAAQSLLDIRKLSRKLDELHTVTETIPKHTSATGKVMEQGQFEIHT